MSTSSPLTAVAARLLLILPSGLLLGIVLVIYLGLRVTSILRDPEGYAAADPVVQTLTQAVYWRTRTHWQTIPECAEFDSELLYQPRPGTCQFRNAEFSTTMHFDGRRARRTPEPAAAPDGYPRPRVVVLGDSYAMGWGVEDDETFAALLASRYGYPTVNLGVSSYATPRELRRLERDFELNDGDVIVIQYSDNDLEENRRFATVRQTGPYQAAELEAMQAYRPTPVKPLLVSGLILRIATRYLLDKVATAFGTRTRHRIEFPDETTALLEVMDGYELWRRHTTLVVPIARPGQDIALDAAELQEAGIGMITVPLSADDFFAIDDHLRARGHAEVARAIADWLSAAPPR